MEDDLKENIRKPKKNGRRLSKIERRPLKNGRRPKKKKRKKMNININGLKL
jgi:hypothetical protein